MNQLHWGYVSVGVGLELLAYLLQGLRWKILLRPLGDLPTGRAAKALFLGIFVNGILPLRAGEWVRIRLVSRWLSRTFSAILPSVFLEYLLDGISLTLGIGLSALLIPFPAHLLGAFHLFGTLIIFGTALLICLLALPGSGAHPGRAPRIPALRRFFENLREGLRQIGRGGVLTGAVGLSLLCLQLHALSFWLISRAFGLRIPFWAGVAVFLIIQIGIIIPNAPANLGAYQFFCVTGLALFGVEKTRAAGFSIVGFVLLTLPVWIVALLSLRTFGMASLRKEIGTWTSERTE
jgi:uncharacterized membrane protein YbhN (UPF0104 family)